MTREETLKRALDCVTGHREEDYGGLEDNFSVIARFWSLYKGIEITAKDVAVMMVLLKVARIKSTTATEDSFVDLAGYAACGAELYTEKKKDSKENERERAKEERRAGGEKST